MRWLTLLFFVFSFNSYSHPGRTDAAGCHMDYSVGKAHCGHKSGSGRSESVNKMHVYKPGSSYSRPSSYSTGTKTFTKSQLSTGSTTRPNNQPYSRGEFGQGWADDDGDCQNSRHEALIAQSTSKVKFKLGKTCTVASGRWISPFTGNVIHDASKIDIDHVVPLKWAWNHGAQNWTHDWREKFANDPINLIPVEASLNRQKGAKGIDKWLPPSNQCQYVLRFIRVMKTYKLSLSGEEQSKFNKIRAKACG